MNIKPARDPNRAPRTRREVLSHIWACPGLESANIFKEGAFYAIRTKTGTAATHRRCIGAVSFATWEAEVRAALAGTAIALS